MDVNDRAARRRTLDHCGGVQRTSGEVINKCATAATRLSKNDHKTIYVYISRISRLTSRCNIAHHCCTLQIPHTHQIVAIKSAANSCQLAEQVAPDAARMFKRLVSLAMSRTFQGTTLRAYSIKCE